jgi:predicted ATPase with chaperone activity
MLARRLTTILPAMTLAEAIETTRIHSVAGLTGDRTALVTNRRDRGSLRSSTATRTGNGSDDFAIRGRCSDNRTCVGGIMLTPHLVQTC